ncbi:MAG TPA: hypothetical protein PLD32_11105 [Saprospiraceae bacterium]|nr:hypothetical protein [Saprospiraceae bacterium]
MKNNVISNLLCLLISGQIYAQTSPLILVSAQSEITYKGQNGKKVNIGPGALLALNGSIKIKGKLPVVLLCNEGFNILPEGKTDLSKICGGNTSVKSIGIDGAYADAILASTELAYLNRDQVNEWSMVRDPKNAAGDGWGVGEKGGWGVGEKGGWGVGEKGGWGVGEKGGWGGSGNFVHLIMPIGKVNGKMIRFSWSQPAGPKKYLLRVMDQNGLIIDSVAVTDTFINLDLSKRPLVAGTRYSWNVTTVEGQMVKSNELPFEWAPGDPKKAIQNKMSKSKIYYKLDASAKAMMEAVAYEEQAMWYHAADIYAKTKSQDKQNNLVKMMAAAFWTRGKQDVMASEALK